MRVKYEPESLEVTADERKEAAAEEGRERLDSLRQSDKEFHLFCNHWLNGFRAVIQEIDPAIADADALEQAGAADERRRKHYESQATPRPVPSELWSEHVHAELGKAFEAVLQAADVIDDAWRRSRDTRIRLHNDPIAFAAFSRGACASVLAFVEKHSTRRPAPQILRAFAAACMAYELSDLTGKPQWNAVAAACTALTKIPCTAASIQEAVRVARKRHPVLFTDARRNLRVPLAGEEVACGTIPEQGFLRARIEHMLRATLVDHTQPK